MPDPVAAFAEATEAKKAAERGGMDVIDTSGPTNLADTATLDVRFPDVIDYHDLYVEVRGDNTSDSSSESVQLDLAQDVAVLHNGTWITSPASEVLVTLPSSAAVGDTGKATFGLSLASSTAGTSKPRVRVKASGAVDNVELRLIGRRNP